MKQYEFHLVDVFTDRQFAGNQLAVLPDARGLDAATMQKLAREFNFSESTFVLPAKHPNNDFHVRIFTPTEELPMAGHPTVGTAYVLARKKLIEQSDEAVTVKFEEGIGVIPVTLTFRESQPDMITMQQPLPEFGPEFSDRKIIAEILSLQVGDLVDNLPVVVVSCGVPFLYVPIRNLKAMKSIRYRPELAEKHLNDLATKMIFAFAVDPETAEGTVHSRMFEPAMGIGEDPATGAASGPLGCYLVHYGVLPAARDTKIVSEQGFEIGRPSIIRIEIDQDDHDIKVVRVGGRCAYLGGGVLEVADHD